MSELLAAAEEPPTSSTRDEQLTWHVRGKLAGALDWNSAVPIDERVRGKLELSWFGGPGPARMARSSPSASRASGRGGRPVLVAGQRHVIAVDAYNGTELWSHEFITAEEAKAKDAEKLAGLCADDRHAYFRLGEQWQRVDAQTGGEEAAIDQLPEGLEEWGRIPRRENPHGLPLREHVLTGGQVPRVYFRAYGCNQVLSSGDVDFFRSGTLGYYDLQEDSGIRNFGGVRPGLLPFSQRRAGDLHLIRGEQRLRLHVQLSNFVGSCAGPGARQRRLVRVLRSADRWTRPAGGVQSRRAGRSP